MAYVAAEVKNPRRNIVRALVLGSAAVTVLYLLVNGAFLYTLGYRGLATSKAVATDCVSMVFPKIGGQLIGALVCISALGAVNGLIFTGARISYGLGAEHRAFGILGRWHGRTGTPIWALSVQGAIAVALIVIFGSFVDTILYTATAVYSFYLATSLSVIVLRYKEPKAERPYRVTGYPVTTLAFCAVCVFSDLQRCFIRLERKARKPDSAVGDFIGRSVLILADRGPQICKARIKAISSCWDSRCIQAEC